MIKTKLLAAILFLTLFTLPVLAKERPIDRSEIKTRLTETRLKSCEAREEAIKNRSASLERLVNNMLEKFSAITERVKNFYTEKVISSGNEVANYDDLVSDVETKEDAVQDALADAQDIMDDFSCDSDDPRAVFAEYKDSMQVVKEALKEYRTSIKNLIVAVHSAAEDIERTNDE